MNLKIQKLNTGDIQLLEGSTVVGVIPAKFVIVEFQRVLRMSKVSLKPMLVLEENR